MDLRFSLREARRRAAPAGKLPPRAAHARLIAGLAAAQAATPTARAAARLPRAEPRENDPVEPLVTLLAGERNWEAAPDALRGSFHPKAARKLGPDAP